MIGWRRTEFRQAGPLRDASHHPSGGDEHGRAGSPPRPQRIPGRQIHHHFRSRVSHRLPGAGAPPDDPARARPGRRAQHRRLRVRLPGLAAGRAGSQPVEGRRPSGRARHRVPARHQRRPGRHRGVGHPAAGPVAQGAGAGGVRDVVRQGAGGRPLRRRLPPRQRRRQQQVWWRAGDRRRRPRGQVVHPAPPDRPLLQVDDDAGAGPGRGAGVPRLRRAWLGAVALVGLLGGLQGGGRHRRDLGLGGRGPDAGGGARTRRLRDARRRPQPALARPAAGAGEAPAPPQALRGAGLLPGQRAQPGGDRLAAAAAGHHHRRQELPRRAPGPRRPGHRRGPRR